MAKTVIKLGQTLNLQKRGDVRASVRLHAIASEDSPVKHILTGFKVKVRKISFIRPRGPDNVLWLEVVGVDDPGQVGWIRFNCGGWDEGNVIRIASVVFEPRRVVPPKAW